MDPALALLTPLVGLGLYVFVWWLRGARGGRVYLNLVVSLWLFLYFLLTAGLGLYWVARMDLPVFDLHYLSGYVLFLLVILHVALQWSKLWRAFRKKTVMQAFLGVLIASGVVLPLPLLWGRLAPRPRPVAVLPPAGEEALKVSAVRPWRPPRRVLEESGMQRQAASWVYEITALSRWGGFRFPPVRRRPPMFLREDPKIPLPPPRERAGRTYHEVLRENLEPEGFRNRLTLQDLSDLLHHTYGVTGRRVYPTGTLLLRAAPSAGALYPLDLFVMVRGMEDLPDGVYLYHASSHSLIPWLEGGSLPGEALPVPTLLDDVPVAFAVCATWDRTAWKYQDRAWRYVFLDGGHALANLLLAGAALGIPFRVEPRFDDHRLLEGLGLSPREQGCLALAVPGPALRVPWIRRPEPLEYEENLPAAVTAHRLTGWRFAEDLTRSPEGNPPPVVLPEAGSSMDLFQAIRIRRSVRTYAAHPLHVREVAAFFREVWAFRHLTPGKGLRLYGVVHRVEGLAPGVYRYEPGSGALRRIREGNFRRAVYRAGVEQELLLSAALVVVWAVSWRDLGGMDGDREFRYALLDAGMGGTHVYLSGVIRRWGVCGVGAFFDRELQEVLGEEVAPIYMLAVGPR